MKTDKTFTDKGTSRAVTEGPISTMAKGSHPTNQMNRTSASRVPAHPIHSSTTKDHLFSSEKKTDPKTLDFSPAPTSEEKSNPMNPIANPNRVDSCIHKQTKDVATIEGHSSSSTSTPTTIVGTEPLASQCLHDGKPANDADCIETGQSSNGAAAAAETSKIPRSLQRREPVDDNDNDHIDAGQGSNGAAAAAVVPSKIPRSVQRGESVDDIDRIEAGQGSNGAAAAAAAASKIPCSVQRDEQVDDNDNDRIEAGQGSNGDVASCLHGGGSCTELTKTNNMVHDLQNISKLLHAAVGATSLIGEDVDEKNETAISSTSTSTDKGNYLFLPEEEMDTADAAAKSVPKASAVNETGRSTKEAVKEVSTCFLKLYCFFYSVLL